MGRGLGPACPRVFDNENKLHRGDPLTLDWVGELAHAVVQGGPPVVACQWGSVVTVGRAVDHLGRFHVAPRLERLYGNHSETVVIRMNGKNWFAPLYAGLKEADNL